MEHDLILSYTIRGKLCEYCAFKIKYNALSNINNFNNLAFFCDAENLNILPAILLRLLPYHNRRQILTVCPEESRDIDQIVYGLDLLHPDSPTLGGNKCLYHILQNATKCITMDPLYNGIHYNSKVLYNVNLVCTKVSGSCIFSLILPCYSLRKHTFCVLV